MILKLIGWGLMTIALTGAFMIFFPETTVKIIANGLSQVSPMQFDPNSIFGGDIDEDVEDLLDKDPETEEVAIEVPINFEFIDVPTGAGSGGENGTIPPTEGGTEPSNETGVWILGRPKKIVEFFCTSDIQCSTYFMYGGARCELSSGICYILK